MDMTLSVENAEKAGIQSELVKTAVSEVFSGEKVPVSSISVLFISDDEIKLVNKKYLNHDITTDVITFPLNDEPEPVEGEIYISIDTTRQNSEEFGVTHKSELLRVAIHGALHLAGFDDSTSISKSEMKAKENYYLNLIGESSAMENHREVP